MLLVLLRGMGIEVSGEDTELDMSGLGSDTKTLSWLSLTFIAEGVSLISIKGVKGVLSSR